MNAEDKDFLSLLLVAAQRSEQRDWARNHAGGRLSREDAVQRVANVLTEQLGSPFPEKGPGADLVIGLTWFGDYFSTSTPTDDEISIVIERATSDYYAHQALCHLSDITGDLRPEILKEWERRHRLGLVQRPRKPRGPSPRKYSHKEMLVLNQIRQLEAAGFKPTRNSEAKKRNSGCDIVAEAM